MISTLDERKQFLARKRLYPNHHTGECFSGATCQHYRKRHRTSICDRDQTDSRRQTLMTAIENNEGILPVVMVKVDGITCRALIDTGAGSSYASAKLLDILKKKHAKRKQNV